MIDMALLVDIHSVLGNAARRMQQYKNHDWQDLEVAEHQEIER